MWNIFCKTHTYILSISGDDDSKTRPYVWKNTNTSICSRSDSWNSRKCTYWFATMLVYVMPGSVISPITRLLVPVSPWRQCAKLSGIVPVAANWETTETEFGPNPINPSVASCELAKFPVRTFPHLLPMHPQAHSKFLSTYKSVSPDQIGKACHWKSFIWRRRKKKKLTNNNVVGFWVFVELYRKVGPYLFNLKKEKKRKGC